MPLSDRYNRPRAYDDDVYKWHLGRVPKKVETKTRQGIPNPARNGAIFVVHGMGTQRWAETAGVLRSGFEDALERLYKDGKARVLEPEDTPSPFIYEGFWANYDDLEQSFPEDWKRLEGTKRDFFSLLWRSRTKSAIRTLFWFLYQQLRLLKPSVLWKLGIFPYIMYVLLQVVSLTILVVLCIVSRKTVAQVLGDVRLYAAPRGIIERAIVQRIDRRVGERFLAMMGLDWEFERLGANNKQRVLCDKKPVEFDRIIWVAHSLGSVISYNVLSDLFHRAAELEKSGTPAQRNGVERFRHTLRRFVTIGSPLDKFAFLWGNDVLRPWPDKPRTSLLEGAERIKSDEGETRDWWINFHHTLDPVSGALSDPLICHGQPPLNSHVNLVWKIPGYAHVQYWKDKKTLRYVLSRVYGKEILPDMPHHPDPGWKLRLLALWGYLTWGALIGLILSPLFKYLLVPVWDYLSNHWWEVLKAVFDFFNPFH